MNAKNRPCGRLSKRGADGPLSRRSGGLTVGAREEKLLLRLPGALKERLKAQAERNRRSLNSEIVVILESQSLWNREQFLTGEEK